MSHNTTGMSRNSMLADQSFCYTQFIYQPFCKYICPIESIYSLFNKLRFYQMHTDKTKCKGKNREIFR